MIAAIEDAMIARIKAAYSTAPGFGYALKEIVSYGGELDEDLAQVVRRFPAVWVTFAGCGKSKPVGTSGKKWKTPVTFAVMVGARNVRDERSTRQGMSVAGEVREVGVYQLVRDVSLLLLNHDLGLAISPLTPGAVRTLYNTRLNGQALAVLAREWHTEFIEEQPREPIDITDPMWLSVGINYYLKPGDAVADAGDTITLS